MFSSQVIVPLIVLLISSGALSNGDLKCAYEDEPKACQRMNSAYRQNGEVAQQLKDARFYDVKQEISDTNRVILQAIKTAEKEDLLVLLHRALSKELSVMFQLKLRCSGEKSKTLECEDGFRGLSHAILNLVDAMYYIADEKRRDAIDKADDAFHNYVRERNKSDVGHPYDFGMKVLTAIGSSLGKRN